MECLNTECPNNSTEHVNNCKVSAGKIDACPDRIVVKSGEQVRPAAIPEPMSTGNGKVVITEVMRDLLARDEVGQEKYKTSLKTNNGRDALMDAYQESLDLAMYLKQALMERGESQQ